MGFADRATGARTNSLGLNRGRLSVCGALLVVAIGALFGSGPALAATTPRALTPSYLFSIPTASGTLTGPNDRHLTLRLTGTRDYLTRFTDRPLRDAFVVANVDFARRFKTYFAASDPNAVLTYTPPGAQIPVSIVLTIGHARWDAHHHTWTFSATRIRKQPDNLPGTSIQINPPLIPNPHRFRSATLLIDGGSTSVGDPTELTGDGIADSLSGFLQQMFATTLPGISGNELSVSVGVEYSYVLTSPDGSAQSTVLLPVLFTEDPFRPNIDLRVAPGGLPCAIEQNVIQWQDDHDPPQVDSAYTFDLRLRSTVQPFYTDTLQYAGATSGVVSAGCSG
jgi:hypothetical protein